MKFHMTQTSIATLKPKDKPYWLTDDDCKNLRLYVGTSDKAKAWYARYRDEYGKSQTVKLGPADALTVAQAREMARKVAVRVSQGEPVKKEKPAEVLALGAYLNDIYFPYARRSLKSADETIRKITANFTPYFSKPINGLSPVVFEKWRNTRMADGAKTATVNKILSALTAALNWGVKKRHIPENPLRGLGKEPEKDSTHIVRYLSPDERERLENALIEREGNLLDETESAKENEFFDYLRPAVLLSLNTGIRRNTLFSLLWGDVDFTTQTVCLRGEIAKNSKTARIPINDDAADVLMAWREQSIQSDDSDLVFPSKTGGKVGNFQHVWRAWGEVLKMAQIDNFRWHDMRHDFASQLVMKGVDLNVVRELLCHSDIKMTMRYAHLAPEFKLNAVQVLNRRTKGDKVIGRIRKVVGDE
ncbi:site-specific integrase [Synergistaceae bacterium OttesenSCG-928-I11]|nr:site-specific integrase [Synergistaceae bacterium OttesenSCG-928-I11]